MSKAGNVIVKMVALLLFLFFAGAATAEKIGAEKIGLVDVREIMFHSETGKKANDELKKLYEQNRLIIQGRESELQKLREEMEKQRSLLTEAALKEKEAAYQQKIGEYQGLVKEANEKLESKDQEFSKKILPEIQKVITSIAEKEKYTVIFDISAFPVPYFNKANDLTKRVMDEFNRTHKSKK